MTQWLQNIHRKPKFKDIEILYFLERKENFLERI
jgi:hypothetical protein